MGIYMKYGEIKGDATQEGFQHWINITGFQWSGAVSRKIETHTGKGRNREQAQPHVSQITITKEVDHSSGPLYKSLVSVPQAKDCRIAFVRTDEGGETYLEYNLTDALLANLKLNGDGDRASEIWTLDFTKIKISVKQLSEANESSNAFHFEYDLATGKGH
ncbi:MAG TPA: type VI secretion system tube protein Hcp [Stellaceae bacterium]|jgi:type VI secretion system secreted protein Hcp